MSSNYVNIPGWGYGQGLTPVVDVFDLPVNGNNIGDTRLVLDTYLSYFWNGTAWALIPSNNGGGGGGGSNASVGPTGASSPASATLIGATDSNGKLQGLLVDPAGKLLVDTSGTSTITGTVDANINGLSTFQTSQYSVGTSAVQITPTPLANRSSLSLKTKTNGTDLVYVGNSSSVTASSGYILFNGDSLQIDLTPVETVYVISNGTSPIVYVLEIGD